MLMCMIGKLSKDWKADWLNHLSKLVHPYNSTRSAITRYSPHYLIFRHWPHLTIDFYFPMIGDTKNTSVLTTTSPIYVNNCVKPLKRLKCGPHQRQRDKSSTTIGKLSLFHWNQVTWYWLKAMPIGEGGKWRISWRRNPMEWSTKLQKASLPTSWRTIGQNVHGSSTEINFFSSLWQRGLMSVWLCRLSGPGASTLP